MGRLSDIIPPLYYGGSNDLIRFTGILDDDVTGLERQVRGITDLINIDKCPDDKLPYLAALTNCPLIGDDPAFWRRQIRNWPYILKLKGTQRSLELVLDSIGADSWDIKTFFRDAGGGYVTVKPTGQPFKDNDGLWHNIRTHYFGIEFTMGKDFVERADFNWDVEEVREKLRFWFEHGKPYHAELLNMIILPPKFLPDDHICRWDICTWEHARWKRYDWGLLTPANPFFEHDPNLNSSFTRGIFTVSDVPYWDFCVWGEMFYRLLQVGRTFETGIFAELEDDIGTWHTPSNWGGFSWSEARRFYRPVGSMIERSFNALMHIEGSGVLAGAIPFTGIICNARPYWDLHTWKEHYTWREAVEQPPVASCPNTGLPAALEWGNDAPKPRWSRYKTWARSNTWRTTSEQAAACSITRLRTQEVAM